MRYSYRVNVMVPSILLRLVRKKSHVAPWAATSAAVSCTKARVGQLFAEGGGAEMTPVGGGDGGRAVEADAAPGLSDAELVIQDQRTADFEAANGRGAATRHSTIWGMAYKTVSGDAARFHDLLLVARLLPTVTLGLALLGLAVRLSASDGSPFI